MMKLRKKFSLSAKLYIPSLEFFVYRKACLGDMYVCPWISVSPWPTLGAGGGVAPAHIANARTVGMQRLVSYVLFLKPAASSAPIASDGKREPEQFFQKLPLQAF
ncbi:hypothetical protein EVAR_102722_1 [Eumeta japonica]|uniref:Uncharacterized protein n=1 Tax=Eumeta variegata TaxID=151549 RepID=A0A4C1TKX7_EUMVA|nr:hypothetical protein EVAR_102722_1 [Eumeta japonica]